MFIIGRSVTVRDDDVAPNAPHQSQVAESLRDEVVLEWLIYKFNNFTVPSRYLFQLFAKILFFIVSICSKNHSCIIISGIIYRNN